MPDKFVISFHESFSISRESLKQILRNAQENNGKFSKKFLINTPLGTNYQKAMPRYAFRSGLLDKNNSLTIFGQHVAKRDLALEKSETQWLLHYHLASPHGATSFWNRLVRKYFLVSNSFNDEDLISYLTDLLKIEANKSPAPRSIRSTITAFTGTYLKTDGLRRLNLLQETVQNTYRVQSTDTPPIWALGYALTEYWSAHYGAQLTIDLDDLIKGDFAAIFLLGEERLTNLLLELKQEGMIDLYRTSRPYQVVLLQPNPEYALQRIYKE
ncbi:MAG: DUF4007 family protein [bacterium]|nr:DUF4007 family protein [bacterium]